MCQFGSALHTAARYGNTECIDLLLAAGVDVNVKARKVRHDIQHTRKRPPPLQTVGAVAGWTGRASLGGALRKRDLHGAPVAGRRRHQRSGQSARS